MDKIANMLITIKNGGTSKKEAVEIPYSNLKADIARALFSYKYIKSYAKKARKKGDILEIDLLYKEDKVPSIQEVKRISKPSRRLYAGVKDIYRVKNGYGLLVLSTPKGILSGDDARKEMVGGEILFEIW